MPQWVTMVSGVGPSRSPLTPWCLALSSLMTMTWILNLLVAHDLDARVQWPPSSISLSIPNHYK